MTRSVCTVVVNYRSAELTHEAVEAALASTTRLARAPIFVIDNHSEDGSLDALALASRKAGWPERVTLRDSGKNGGYGFGNNVGFRLGLALDPPPDYFLVLNPDAFLEEDAVEALLRYAESHPEVGIFGSAARGPDGARHCTAFRFPSMASELEGGARLGPLSRALAKWAVPLGLEPGEGPVDWVGGMCVLIRREVLERVGLFDEKFFLYFEETDLCRRAREAGFLSAYVPSSRVVHIGSAVTGVKDMTRPLPRFWYDSRRRYFEKHHGRAYAMGADVSRLLGELVFRARSAVSAPVGAARKPRFLRDFAAHALQANLRALSRPAV